MKHLFLLLLAVNIGLFIWGYQREQAAEHTKTRVRADVGSLRLLTEQKRVQEPELIPGSTPVQEPLGIEVGALRNLMMIAATEPDSIVTMPEHAETEAEAEAEAEQRIPTEDEVNEDVRLAPQVEDELSQSREQGIQIEITEVVDAEEDSDGDHPGQQVKELQPKERAKPDQSIEIAQEPQAEAVESQPLKLACYRLGPIVDAASIEGLLSHLKQLGLDAVMHKKSIKEAKGYWVMSPAQASYKQAKQKLKELKKAGISDLWLFPKGEYKNAISLGLYSRFSNAEAAQKRALKKGVPTEVITRYVKIEQYWLEFQSAEQTPVVEESRLALQEAYPSEEFELKSCSTVVTE